MCVGGRRMQFITVVWYLTLFKVFHKKKNCVFLVTQQNGNKKWSKTKSVQKCEFLFYKFGCTLMKTNKHSAKYLNHIRRYVCLIFELLHKLGQVQLLHISTNPHCVIAKIYNLNWQCHFYKHIRTHILLYYVMAANGDT